MAVVLFLILPWLVGGWMIKVMEPDGDVWPLPWYLRRFNKVGWWTEIPQDPYAPVMIVSTKFQAELDAPKTHIMVGIFQMRPQVFFELYVEKDLWSRYLEARKGFDGSGGK